MTTTTLSPATGHATNAIWSPELAVSYAPRSSAFIVIVGPTNSLLLYLSKPLRCQQTLIRTVTFDISSYSLRHHPIHSSLRLADHYKDALFIHPPVFVYTSALARSLLGLSSPALALLYHILTAALIPVMYILLMRDPQPPARRGGTVSEQPTVSGEAGPKDVRSVSAHDGAPGTPPLVHAFHPTETDPSRPGDGVLETDSHQVRGEVGEVEGRAPHISVDSGTTPTTSAVHSVEGYEQRAGVPRYHDVNVNASEVEQDDDRTRTVRGGLLGSVLFLVCPIGALCSQKIWIDNALLFHVTAAAVVHMYLIRNLHLFSTNGIIYRHLLSGFLYGAIAMNTKITALFLLPFLVTWSAHHILLLNQSCDHANTQAVYHLGESTSALLQTWDRLWVFVRTVFYPTPPTVADGGSRGYTSPPSSDADVNRYTNASLNPDSSISTLEVRGGIGLIVYSALCLVTGAAL
eukprot:gene9747-12507_t